MKFNFLKVGERLRNKILLGVALVAFIPFMASGLFALYLMNRAHANDVSRIETNLLNQKQIEVQKYVSDSIDQLAIILPLPSDSLVRILRPEEVPANKALIRTLTDGRRIVFGIDPPSQLDDVLTNALLVNKAFNELYFIDKQTGLEVAYKSNYPSTFEGFADFSRLPEFNAAKSGGNNYAGEVNFTIRGPVINMAAPVKNTNGTTVGVLAGELSLSGLRKVFAATALGNSGYVYLLDSDGKLLYNSDGSKATGVSPAGPPASGQTQYQSAWGKTVVGAASPVFIPGAEKPWTLVAEWPTQDANQVIDTLRWQFIFFLFFVLVLTVLFSVFLANRIVKPINVLQVGTERIASGVFDAPVDIHTHDEIEDLGTAFNKMMAGLKQLQELKDEFVFIAAHELRTPVAAIKGYLSMLMDGSVGVIDDAAKGFIKKVMNANQRLIQLVNDLLQVARSEAGKLTIQVAATDVAEPIQSTLDELAPLAKEKSITMNYEPKDAAKVMADPVRLKEVLVNLVGNAIKYSGNGGSVIVSHEVQDKNLVVHVADTGFGITKAAQARLFEKFYRVQTEKTREITGTGLGLFIVKQIIEKMNGKIWVDSEEGKGSVFSFSLPLAS